MPLADCTLAGTLSHSVRTLGPYISFFLLAFIGVGMIQDAAADKGGTAALSAPPRGKRLAALAIATSIDAFAVGVSFAFQRVNLLGACLTIGGITFCLSVLAAILGGHFPRLSSRKAGIIGGAVLLAMGVKLLLQGLLGH